MCSFVFPYAKSRFSREAVVLILDFIVEMLVWLVIDFVCYNFDVLLCCLIDNYLGSISLHAKV